MYDAEVVKMTTDYKEYLSKWIVEILDKPQAWLNNLPSCPYAKQALINNRIDFKRSYAYVADVHVLFNNWDEKFDVVVLVCDRNINSQLFSQHVAELNKQYVPQGYACLEDHVDCVETVKDINFNNGKYNLILCQPLNKLNAAAAHLHRQGYYNHWTKDYYDQVVSWRLPTTN
jgi:hypothetical protein